ncbi:hypothetical protein Ahy_B08g091822 [Arachis hypogaea]|uniref:Uncharacterized protein n=1 Tax=Arachis hypogaea TaxID=3818 RepID=A0A444Y2T0_ARAHY|nr:hypothetical protein Ahy_B08g091822 [Arachis hypogaea]
MGMKFSSQEPVIAAVKDYAIRRGVDYQYLSRPSKLDYITIVEVIQPLVEANPCIKVKSVIAEVQSKFKYTISYRKASLAKQKSVEKNIQWLGSL